MYNGARAPAGKNKDIENDDEGDDSCDECINLHVKYLKNKKPHVSCTQAQLLRTSIGLRRQTYR